MNIELWFLVLSLFLPRIALLIAYTNHQIPPNSVPFWGDFFMTLFVPRVLILIYIMSNMGICGWFWLHLVFLILTYGGSSSCSCNKK